MVGEELKKQTYAYRIWREVIVKRGAQIGLAWIVILAMLAVLAPLLANSHPILMSQDGEWSSPLVQNLTALDVILLSGSVIILSAWFLRDKALVNIITIAVSLILVSILSVSLVSPPQITVYEQYREMEKNEQLDWLINTPIPYSPKDYLRDYGDTGLEDPLQQTERIHLFGTDRAGADVLSRMIHASRIALGIGFVATGIAMVIGVLIGGLMGFFSGVTDMLGMRVIEIFEAIPVLFLLLTFVAFFGNSIYMMMVIIGLTSWPGYARFVRAEFLKLRQMDYVQSAITSGLPLASILFRHILPNGVAPVLVAASFGVAQAILAEAILSFLGLGLIDDPSWGQMLNQAVQSASFYWWMAFFPGGAIFLTVFAYNLIGEALRDAIDPYLKKKS